MWIKVILATLLMVGVAYCGVVSRVVNGTDSSIRKYPFMASLRYSSGEHTCGCSIIAQNWVLTAAHCVAGEIANTISIQYAVTDIDEQGPNIAKVKRIIIHRAYSQLRNYANDIALLELSQPLIYNYKMIAPVSLPVQGHEVPQVPEGGSGVLLGWGLEATGGNVQRTLQEVDLKIFSDMDCYYRHQGVTTIDQICAGADEGGKGQCGKDSGGPLLQKVPGGLIQVGIVSWSIKPCGLYPYPGVYTKVSHYINWIKDNMIDSA